MQRAELIGCCAANSSLQAASFLQLFGPIPGNSTILPALKHAESLIWQHCLAHWVQQSLVVGQVSAMDLRKAAICLRFGVGG